MIASQFVRNHNRYPQNTIVSRIHQIQQGLYRSLYNPPKPPGVLSREEIGVFSPTEFAQIDKNNDGRLQQREFEGLQEDKVFRDDAKAERIATTARVLGSAIVRLPVALSSTGKEPPRPIWGPQMHFSTLVAPIRPLRGIFARSKNRCSLRPAYHSPASPSPFAENHGHAPSARREQRQEALAHRVRAAGRQLGRGGRLGVRGHPRLHGRDEQGILGVRRVVCFLCVFHHLGHTMYKRCHAHAKPPTRSKSGGYNSKARVLLFRRCGIKQKCIQDLLISPDSERIDPTR